MDKKQRFFIYDRKEVGVLLLLGVMVAVFAFTLGVHLGKRVTGKALAPHAMPSEGIAPVAEAPTHSETETAMTQPTSVPPGMVASSEEAANQATHEEVARTGIKLEDTRQLELPEKAHSKNAGATTPEAPPAAQPQTQTAQSEEQTSGEEEQGEEPVQKKPNVAQHKHGKQVHGTPAQNKPAQESAAAESETPAQKEALAELKALNEKAAATTAGVGSSKYTLQIGSYADMKEAQARVKDLEISGLSPRIQPIDIKSKGRWYRIYLGGFPTKIAAEKAGEKYRSQGMIGSFIVAKSVE